MLGLAAFAVCAAFAQNAAPPPAFEVASVKPAPQNEAADFRTYPGGRLTMTNLTLEVIIREAFTVKHYQISGGPRWLESDRFDIEAKADGNPSREQMMAMLAGRLAEIEARPVLDRTGLKGEYDFKLDYAIDNNPDTGPSIFSALQEQLGLKLETAKGPVEVLIIDKAEKPSAN